MQVTEIQVTSDKVSVIAALSDLSKLLSSRGEAKRKIQEGAVEIDGSKVTDINLELSHGKEYKIRVGKKFVRLLLKK